MRATSARRRAAPRGTRYEGNPGVPAKDTRGEPKHLAEPGQGVECPDCGAYVKTNQSGSIKAHSAGGHVVSLPRGYFACPSSGCQG